MARREPTSHKQTSVVQRHRVPRGGAADRPGAAGGSVVAPRPDARAKPPNPTVETVVNSSADPRDADVAAPRRVARRPFFMYSSATGQREFKVAAAKVKSPRHIILSAGTVEPPTSCRSAAEGHGARPHPVRASSADFARPSTFPCPRPSASAIIFRLRTGADDFFQYFHDEHTCIRHYVPRRQGPRARSRAIARLKSVCPRLQTICLLAQFPRAEEPDAVHVPHEHVTVQRSRSSEHASRAAPAPASRGARRARTTGSCCSRMEPIAQTRPAPIVRPAPPRLTRLAPGLSTVRTNPTDV